MAKGKKGGGKAPKLGGEMLLVGSKVRAAISSAGLRTAGDALDGLNAAIGQLITQATKRAAANGRQTVRSHDFTI
jgi:hypothetical protein